MLRQLVLIAILFAALPVFGSEQKEIALHIAIVDHMAFTNAAFDEVNAFLAEAVPHLEVRSIKVETSVIHKNRESTRDQILGQLSLKPTDVVSHLILDTHGDSANDTTTLAYFGKFDRAGADEDLAELLQPLKGHLAPDLTIVLNSCSTLCGLKAPERTKALLADLGAPDAQIYGSTTPEIERPGLLTGKRNLRAYLGDVAQLKLFIALGAALGIPYSLSTHSNIVFSTAAAAATLYSITIGLKALLAKFGAFNLGRIQTFRNGELIEDKPVEKYASKFEVYGSCRALFR